MILDECYIFVYAWQMQCCGEPFKIGDYIKWFGKKNSPEEVDHGFTIPYSEDHHGEGNLHIHGTVDYIWAEVAISHFQADDSGSWEYKFSPVQSADGWDFENREENDDNVFWGYIVRLKNVEIRPYTRRITVTKLNKKTYKQFRL